MNLFASQSFSDKMCVPAANQIPKFQKCLHKCRCVPCAMVPWSCHGRAMFAHSLTPLLCFVLGVVEQSIEPSSLTYGGQSLGTYGSNYDNYAVSQGPFYKKELNLNKPYVGEEKCRTR